MILKKVLYKEKHMNDYCIPNTLFKYITRLFKIPQNTNIDNIRIEI